MTVWDGRLAFGEAPTGWRSSRAIGLGAVGTVPCPTVTDLARRRVLQGSLGLGAVTLAGTFLGACGDDSNAGTAGSAGPASDRRSRHALLAAFPQSTPHIPAGVPTRLPYLISDPDGVPMASIDDEIEFTVAKDGTVLDTVVVTPRNDGVPRAYLPLTTTFPEPGLYDIAAVYDGSTIDSTVEVFERSEVAAPVVGDPLPPVDSPTSNRPLGVDPLCSRRPICPHHSTNLTDALTDGRPIVMVIATPAYCQTAVCGPLLELVMEQTEGRTDLLVLHQEVYLHPETDDDLAGAALAPVPAAYGIDFEPLVYVTDSSATIVARADVTLDRSELADLLELAV